ncbi:hypothetical protein [Brevundimonas aveniformis]|uniref:hypothetical protein n=1 Tax=Brevundimonas aveniformis TaxID=370977 RepID=UPI0012EC88A3|nr:hypothetical protein [Brevundimonas aveniformis]
MITITWEAAGIPLEEMVAATSAFLDCLGKHLKASGHERSWIWVHENGPQIGGHCHILAHVPSELVKKLTRLQTRWIKQITNRPYAAKTIKSVPIGGRLGLETSNPHLHEVNFDEAVDYLLKGAESDVRAAFGIRRSQPGGLIIGKRCGASNNLLGG